MPSQSAEQTFLNFTPAQAKSYSTHRGQLSYPADCYDRILQYHTHTPSNVTDTFLDVGTGTGKVVHDLLRRGEFERGIGCDSSPEMIAQAKREAVDERAEFMVKEGEKCGERMEKQDLVTAAMAVHWFSIPEFYASAASALKPNGTLAMWTCCSMYVHPSHANAAEMQAILSDVEDNVLKPHEESGNMISRSAYRTLPLPWQIPSCQGLFEEDSFERVDWDTDGVPSAPPGKDGSPGPFLVMPEPTTLGKLEKALGSSSMVIRWREANPKLAEGAQDPVKITVRRLREANGGEGSIWVSASLHLLLMRRSA